MISHDTYFDIPAHVLSRDVDGETVILDMEGSVYCGLEVVGALFWDLISQDKNMGEVIAAILTDYDVKQSELETDLQKFVNELLGKNLLTLRP